MLRIRPRDSTVIELNIPQDQRDEVQRVLNGDMFAVKKKNIIKSVTGYRACLMCGSVPDIQLSYDVGEGAKVVETYCHVCSGSKVFEKIQDKSLEEIASVYNCVKVDSIPHYSPTYIKSKQS